MVHGQHSGKRVASIYLYAVKSRCWQETSFHRGGGVPPRQRRLAFAHRCPPPNPLTPPILVNIYMVSHGVDGALCSTLEAEFHPDRGVLLFPIGTPAHTPHNPNPPYPHHPSHPTHPTSRHPLRPPTPRWYFLVLFTLQDHEEFASHRLNKDVWSNETILTLLRGNFIFWQRNKVLRQAR